MAATFHCVLEGRLENQTDICFLSNYNALTLQKPVLIGALITHIHFFSIAHLIAIC